MPVDFDPFGNNVTYTIATTPHQREIFSNVIFGGHDASCAYNESVSLLLKGPFDQRLLQSCVDELVLRHESLRSVFTEDGLHMNIDAGRRIKVHFINLSASDPTQVESALSDQLNLEAETEFNIFNGPLGRVTLIKLSEIRHQLILTFHHIICDGWSLGIIMQDLGRIYSSKRSGEGLIELPPAVSLIQLEKAEADFASSELSKETEEFWVNMFRDKPAEMELSIDKKRPPVRTFRAQRIDHTIDKDIIAALKKMGTANGVSYVTTLLSAFEVFLSKITGSADVTVGLPAAGQSVYGLDHLVGHCVNLLPMRTFVDDELSFVEYLKIRKSQIFDAYDHQQYTFGSLLTKLNIPRDPSRIPLVPVSFNVDIGITNDVEFADCEFEFSTNPRHYENFEIFINAAGNGNELTLECTFNTDLFSEYFMKLRMEEFANLLKLIADGDVSPIRQLNILTENDRKLLLDQWNGHSLNYDNTSLIHELIAAQAVIAPDKIAIEWNDSRVTYKELVDKASVIAVALQNKGLGPGQMVAVCLDRSPSIIQAMLGVLMAGGVYVPVDPEYPLERISYIVKDSDCKMVISDHRNKHLFSESSDLLLADDNSAYGSNSGSWIKPEMDSSLPAYVIYTSGSTGLPKGVVIAHKNAAALFAWAKQIYSDAELNGVLATTSVCFDLSIFEIFNTLVRGGKVILIKNILELLDSDKNLSPVLINTVPSALKELLDAGAKIPDSVTTVNLAGEPLSEQFADELNGISHIQKVYDLYGPSEDTTYSTFTLRKVGDRANIGKVLPNSKLYLLDKSGNLVAPGLPGEIALGGDKVAMGYLNKEHITKEKFVEDRFAGKGRMYLTGDLGKFDANGNLIYLGRNDNQVKVRGYRIELSEIDHVIHEFAGVADCISNTFRSNEGFWSIASYIVWEKDQQGDKNALKKYLSSRLPGYMVPSYFVELDQIPLSPNGKVDRKKLPVPLNDTPHLITTYEEPEGPYEEALSIIFSDVLGVEKVGRNDNFFDLGGHSLLAVRVFNEIEKRLGIKAALPLIFSSPTISRLASVISGSDSSQRWSSVVPFKSGTDERPLFCIHMHNGNIHRWKVIVKHMEESLPVYAIQPKGLDPKQEPHHSIEEMAEYYVEQIQKVQPQGPYRLVGLCFSGMVVFEMAVILQNKGEQVEFLAMVNNYAPPENPTMYKMKSELNKFMKLELGEKFQYALEKNVSLGKKLFARSGNLRTDEALNKNDSIGNDLRTIHSLALLNYHPTHTYDGDLIIIRTDEPIDPYFNDVLGWDRLIKGKITSYVIAGCDNDTIITDAPYNIELAQIVRDHLAGSGKSQTEQSTASGRKNNNPGNTVNAAIL